MRLLKVGKRQLILITLFFSLVGAGTVSAALGQAQTMYAYDQNQSRFNTGVVSLPGDRSHIPVIHPINIDVGQAYVSASDGFCGPGPAGGSSAYAGQIELKLMHQDSSPIGATGFESSRNWQLVDCDFDQDGDFDADDLAVNPTPILDDIRITDAFVRIMATDVITSADCGLNCLSYIVTSLEANLDPDCDGDYAEHAPDSGAVCFYAEAKPADVGGPAWVGPMEGAISIQDTESRVVFSASGPTAVVLEDFSAASSRDALPFAVGLLILTGIIIALLRRQNRLLN